MAKKTSSFHMSNEFNGHGQKTHLSATQYNSYSPLPQTDIRLTKDFGQSIPKALGGLAAMINPDLDAGILLKALGGLSTANQVIIGKGAAAGQHTFSYNISAANEFSNDSYLIANATNNSQIVMEIVPYGWVPYQTVGKWKWGQENGTYLKEGWHKYDGKWYYFSDYWMQTEWKKIVYEGKAQWFYFFSRKNSSGMEKHGHMVTGWIELDYNGQMHWFYFHGKGPMAVSEWIGYKGKWYFQRSDGTMQKSSLREWNGKLYYLKDDGAMAVNETIVDADSGDTYYANEDGVCTKKNAGNALLLPADYYMGTDFGKKNEYIFGINSGSQSWKSYCNNHLVSHVGKNLVTIEVPIWVLNGSAKSSSTKKLTVHEKVSAVVEMIFTEIYDSSERPPIKSSTTCAFVNRYVERNDLYSAHNYGIAIDINWDVNPMLDNGKTSNVYQPGVDPFCIAPNSSMVTIFKKYNWVWGGEWKSKKDYMHFSYNGQ